MLKIQCELFQLNVLGIFFSEFFSINKNSQVVIAWLKEGETKLFPLRYMKKINPVIVNDNMVLTCQVFMKSSSSKVPGK